MARPRLTGGDLDRVNGNEQDASNRRFHKVVNSPTQPGVVQAETHNVVKVVIDILG